MPNLLLAPEDDDSDLPLDHNLGSSPSNNVPTSKSPTEVERLHVRFDPQKVGFGIVPPWPSVDPVLLITEADAVKISIKGKDQGEQG